jgi:hypothetical protein
MKRNVPAFLSDKTISVVSKRKTSVCRWSTRLLPLYFTITIFWLSKHLRESLALDGLGVIVCDSVGPPFFSSLHACRKDKV